MRFLVNICRHYLQRRGFKIAEVPEGVAINSGYALYGYLKDDGSFDYQKYKEVQISGNKRKIENVWVERETVEQICEYLTKDGTTVKNGLCHGSRNGAEVRWFQEILGAEVIGTDISDTAPDFGLVQWDFHDLNEEWIGKFDFIYTNSHDHSYDPKKSISTWVDQLAPGGRLFIEHTRAHSILGVSELDPFGVEPDLFPNVILEFAEGRFAVTDTITARVKKFGHGFRVFVITKI